MTFEFQRIDTKWTKDRIMIDSGHIRGPIKTNKNIVTFIDITFKTTPPFTVPEGLIFEHLDPPKHVDGRVEHLKAIFKQETPSFDEHTRNLKDDKLKVYTEVEKQLPSCTLELNACTKKILFLEKQQTLTHKDKLKLVDDLAKCKKKKIECEKKLDLLKIEYKLDIRQLKEDTDIQFEKDEIKRKQVIARNKELERSYANDIRVRNRDLMVLNKTLQSEYNTCLQSYTMKNNKLLKYIELLKDQNDKMSNDHDEAVKMFFVDIENASMGKAILQKTISHLRKSDKKSKIKINLMAAELIETKTELVTKKKTNIDLITEGKRIRKKLNEKINEFKSMTDKSWGLETEIDNLTKRNNKLVIDNDKLKNEITQQKEHVQCLEAGYWAPKYLGDSHIKTTAKK